MLSAAFKIQYSNNIKGKNSMQTPRLPKYLMLSSFALLTATTSLIFNDHEIKADTAENTAATAVSTTVSNTVVLNSTAQTDIASSAVADDTASLSDSTSSAAGEQRASSSADVLTEVTTPDTGNVTQSDASWTLKGLGNYTFAQVDYYNSNQTAQPAGQLSINASGQPHSYFPNAQYARITVSRGSETLFDQTFIGDQNYRFKQTLQLQAGDILSIEHAEAKTRYTTNNDATMKTSALGDLSRFVFVVANNLSLKNISDYAYLDVKTKQLIDNGRRGRPVTGPGNRPLKSLSHMLKGKQGRFRQNLLGKRVDFSGRSVIAVGPTLKMYQCGVPRLMAIELFKPFVMREIVAREYAGNVKAAKRMVERGDERIWDILEDVIKEHPVLLNRAPTLHRLGIQAFEPVLIDGKALRLHPLVCEAYNADFDGDQMAIHVPLSEEAQAEARLLLLAAEHILNPKDGKPVVTPSQDMVLGNYYLTMEEEGREGEGMVFKDIDEAVMAYRNGYVHLHSRVGIAVDSMPDKPWKENQLHKIMVTTVGKILFNSIIPAEIPYLQETTNENLTDSTPDKYFLEPGQDIQTVIDSLEINAPFKKKNLGNIIAETFKRLRTTETSAFLDRLKDLGYYHSTLAGLTVGIADIPVIDNKQEIIDAAHHRVEEINKAFRRGLMTDDDRYVAVTTTWREAKEALEKRLIETQDPKNPIVMMMDSGARGNISNFSQLAGMRGLMAAPNGRIMELPILSNFREGLSVLEMFFSTHGARKGMTDTALKTADSGYLTRRLVDVAQDVIIREDDCGTDRGLLIRAITDGKEVTETLEERLQGRYTKKSVKNPTTGEVIVGPDTLITEDMAAAIVNAGVEEVTIRSVFTCNTRHGVCRHCYGINLATGDAVEVGEAVGTIAAQSIGEPGTQLTMRTFHTGGVASNTDITQGLPRIQEIFEARNPKGEAVITEVKGTVIEIEEDAATRTKKVFVQGKTGMGEYVVPFTARMKVEVGDEVHRGAALTEGSIQPKRLLEVRDTLSVETYLLAEVQKVYRSQGVEIGDKHVEVMVRQMLRKVRVMDPGDTDLLPGTLMDISDFTDANKDIVISGGVPATSRPVLLGITKASLETNSFLSAASFQETTRVLTDAAIRGKKDHLLGLKENVIIGKTIPAGTGMARYRNIEPLSVNEVEVIENIAVDEAIVESSED